MTQLATTRIQLAEHARNIWVVESEADTPVKAMLDPGYWAHVSWQFGPRDRIEVNAEDGSLFAEFMVLDAGKLFAKVVLLREVSFVSETKTKLKSHEITWGGRNNKWRVIRREDRGLVKAGFEQKGDAEVWAEAHEKRQAETTKAA